ncbi:hypothetical protein, partial [Corynebacterium propinquum]|uniref:hypothetical protein n=1 Tax=Corynebacterium propinquum TaxID=43769 RepID=UPI001C92F357
VATGLGVAAGEVRVALGLGDPDAVADAVDEADTAAVGASVGVSGVLSPPPQAESAKMLMLATRRRECRGDLRGLI